MGVLYEIKVETGTRYAAGTNAKVTISLRGTNGEVGPFKLDKPFHDDLEKGRTDNYRFKDENVGELVMITLKNEGGMFGKNNWFVNKITISKTPNTSHGVFEFPIFRWVINELKVFEGKALLPFQKQDKAVIEQREKEVKDNQKLYRWGSDPTYSEDLPGFIDADKQENLPLDVQFRTKDTWSLIDSGVDGFLNLGLGDFYGRHISWDEFEDYEKCFNPGILGPYPPATDKWGDDVWFGSQFLNGANPDIITRCTELPENFPVTDEMVGNQLDRGWTLQKEMDHGYIYMVDYNILNGIPTFEKGDDLRYIAPAMALFFVRNSGDIVPIAIQLDQIPCDGNPIWTPNDTKYDWLNAKLWLRAADTQHHQMITHLLRCHLMMEPIAVASWRQLPSLHPVWKIIYPHTQGVMAINVLGRQKLIGPGGIADQVLSVGGGGHVKMMQSYYRKVTWESYDLPKYLKERGVDDENKLPNFHYRDDALSLWNALNKFITEVIYVYYSSDQDVVKDKEIKRWAADLSVNGYPSKLNSDGIMQGFPSSFGTRDDLIRFLTMVIFTSSCQHAAVNFSQKDVYGFHPNSPSLMRKPAPSKKNESSLESTMQSLATQHQASQMVAIVNELTTMYPDQRCLGDYDEFLFTDVKVIDAVSNFNQQLDSIEERIKARNNNLEVPYEYLLPKRVPNSIAI